MKIEKINDNQIRCTLTHADLAARNLKISELAYGTEKAKSLFRDMMQQASFDFGFETDDLPGLSNGVILSSIFSRLSARLIDFSRLKDFNLSITAC